MTAEKENGSAVAFPGFVNGGCSRATQVGMRMRINTSAHLSMGVTAHAFKLGRFAALLMSSYPSANVLGIYEGKKTAHLGGCPRTLRTLVVTKGGVRKPKSPPGYTTGLNTKEEILSISVTQCTMAKCELRGRIHNNYYTQ